MQAVDSVLVTSCGGVEKMISTGRGVEVRWILGEETGKKQGTGNRE
jgi:hypothetical protein